MHIRFAILPGIILMGLLQTCGGQGFVNLDFEDANVSGYSPGFSAIPVVNAFPGWRASYSDPNIGTVEVSNVWYDAISLGGAVISINDTNSGFGIFEPIDCNYSAFLFGGKGIFGNFTSSTLSQTGLVPIGTKSLTFSVQYGLNATPLIVSVNGQPINSTTYDISAFAGQTVTLSFTESAPAGDPPSLAILDDIAFIPGPVPEPSTVSLIAIGILILCLCSRIVWPNIRRSPHEGCQGITRFFYRYASMICQPHRDHLSRWLGLMYATGFLLLACGIPAALVISFVFTGIGAGLDHSQALIFGGSMIAAEVVIGSILLYVAEHITKRRHAKNDAAEG
jgi:hypothetical protein